MPNNLLMFKFLTLFFFTGLIAQPQPAKSNTDADRICGRWISSDKNLIVQMYKAGNSYRGKMVWFKSNDHSKSMEEWTDKHNPDPTLRNRKILGIMVYNPEPFNDPKLPAADLVDTIKMTLTLPDATVLTPDQFIVSYSRDNSMAFITNSALDVPLGSIQLSFRYKQFNGIDYETVFEDYIGDAIDITPYF